MAEKFIKDRLIQRVEQLPVLPGVVARLLTLDPSAEDYLDDVIRLVEQEPNYAARLVASANSALTRGVVPIERIRDAVVRLGARAVSNLVVSMSVVAVFVPRTDWERGLWIHALEVACVARALAQCAGQGLDPERAYLSGLLHDIGRFVMFEAAPDSLRQVDESEWASPAELVAAERSICGLDHAELGAAALTRWALPIHFIEFVCLHHDPAAETKLGGVDGRIARLVQIADLTAFSSVSPRPRGPRLVELPPKEREAFLTHALPAWCRDDPAHVAKEVIAALDQADAIGRRLGLIHGPARN